MTYRDQSEKKSCKICGKDFYRDKRGSKKWWDEAKFCSRKCSAAFGASKADKIWGSLEDRFWSKVQKAGHNDCWPWIGAKRPRGYGVISKNGKQVSATHVSLEIDGRPVPKGAWALHKCDNPNCVNPNHLYIGTAKENSRDAVVRERIKRKLTKEQALEIYKSGKDACKLASEYGVSEGMVYHIKTGRKWRYITQNLTQKHNGP